MSKEMYSDAGLAFNSAKASAVVVTATTDPMQEVVTMTTGDLPAGKYMLGYSFELNFNNNKNKPAYFSMGGTYGSATKFAVIATDVTADDLNRYYSFPKDHAGGPITISLLFQKDSGTDVQTVDFADVMVMRVA